MALGLGWIGAALFLSVTQAQAVPRDANCSTTIHSADGDFHVRIKRGLNLAYASPITFTGWRTPAAACTQFNATARFSVKNFRWRGLPSFRENLARMTIATTLSYAWQYNHRYALQRIEPGVELFGAPVTLPFTRWFVNIDLADYWRVRLESTLNLAVLADTPAWLASMGYQF